MLSLFKSLYNITSLLNLKLLSLCHCDYANLSTVGRNKGLSYLILNLYIPYIFYTWAVMYDKPFILALYIYFCKDIHLDKPSSVKKEYQYFFSLLTVGQKAKGLKSCLLWPRPMSFLTSHNPHSPLYYTCNYAVTNAPILIR